MLILHERLIYSLQLKTGFDFTGKKEQDNQRYNLCTLDLEMVFDLIINKENCAHSGATLLITLLICIPVSTG